jgi:hypothetical protein
MRRRQDDLDPPMGAVSRRRHPSRRHINAMDLDRQEHRRRLDASAGVNRESFASVV